MNKYCDTDHLERCWAVWLYSEKSPKLDGFRKHGKLLTRVLGDRCSHIIASTSPVEFESTSGQFDDFDRISSSCLCDFDERCASRYISDGYVYDFSVVDNWRRFAKIIWSICFGITSNFKPKTQDDQMNLAHNAYVCVLDKIQRGKLNYTPGKAPVFNLLTTSIIRIMYTIKNKENKLNDRYMQMVEDYVDTSGVKLKF